jgi:TPR repeat protein
MGRRARFSGRGRERAWWLLAAAVLVAVLGALAQLLAWPLQVWLALTGLAAAAALVVPELRARFKQDDTRAALVTKAVAVPSQQNRLPLVREAGLTQLRVHRAQVQVPYVERDVQQQVAAALGWGRSVLLVGHSMAGKTRLAAQVMRQRFPDAPLLIPESGKALRELVGEGLDPAGVVLWLDDLERFLGPDGLTIDLLTRLASGKSLLIATIRSQMREAYRPRKELRPPEWEVLEAFTRIGLQRRHTDAELHRIRAVVIDPNVLAAVRDYGLAEYLGAGPLSIDKFEQGEMVQPVGRALVQAAVDWRRSGLTHPVPKRVLTSSTLVDVYLTDRPDVTRDEGALDQGLEWATEEINETVALLGRRFTGSAEPSFEAFDYLVDHLTAISPAIPDQLWQLSLQEAQPTEWSELGYAAYQHANLPVAEHAFRKAADTGDGEAMSNLGALLAERGESREAETWWRHAADAGGSKAMFNLGLLFAERGESAEAEAWYRRGAEAGRPEAMFNLGVRLEERGESGEAETWYRRAADAGQSEAMSNLGSLFRKRGESGEAETWYRRAVNAGYRSAMLNLGVLFAERGEVGEAEIWFRRAAEAGSSRAMFNLGGLLAERDESGEAEVWFRRAAETGNGKAMFKLGVLLKKRGESGEAETWWRRAAGTGDGEAMSNLGLLLVRRGEFGGAETWYRQAAYAGQTGAMSKLGWLLQKRGEAAEAETWWRRAAEAGHSNAMFNLGVLFAERGEAGEAEAWWRRAAEAGDSNAMFNLGALFAERGEAAEAETWFRRAADAGRGEPSAVTTIDHRV